MQQPFEINSDFSEGIGTPRPVFSQEHQRLRLMNQKWRRKKKETFL